MTRDYLKSILTYNPDTGVFVWDINKGPRAMKGSIAGTLNKSGYINIKLDGKMYKAHRLAFLYIHGYTPNEIGHNNQNRSDNRIDNLTDVSHAENMRNKSIYKNNKSGIPGVTWHVRMKKWQIHVKIDNKSIHLGYSDDLNEAKKIREDAKRQYRFHENHN